MAGIASSPTSNLGAIVGGVLGGFFGVVILVLIFFPQFRLTCAILTAGALQPRANDPSKTRTVLRAAPDFFPVATLHVVRLLSILDMCSFFFHGTSLTHSRTRPTFFPFFFFQPPAKANTPVSEPSLARSFHVANETPLWNRPWQPSVGLEPKDLGSVSQMSPKDKEVLTRLGLVTAP